MKRIVKKLSIWILVMLMVFGSPFASVSALDNNSGGEVHDPVYEGLKTWKIENPLQNSTQDGITVTFSQPVGSDIRYVSWTADTSVQVRYVWVKASNDGNLYTYSVESSGQDLHGPLKEDGVPYGISHVTIYYEDTALLKVQKVLKNEDGSVVSGDEHPFGVDIKKGEATVNTCNLSNGQQAVFKLPLGTYNVSEQPQQSPYSFVKYTLDGVDSDGSVVLNQKGQTRTLVILNEKTGNPPPAKGTIIIKKVIQDSAGNTDTTSQDEFTVQVKNTASDALTSFVLKNGDLEKSGQFDPGEYQITELGATDYEHAIVLSSDSDNDNKVDLNAGDTVTVTVTNKKKSAPPPTTGSITITKKVVRSNDVTQVIADDLTEFDGRLIYAPETPAGTPPYYSFSVKQNTPAVIDHLPLGRYQVIEESKAGYSLMNNEPIYVEITAADTTGEIMLTNVKLPGPPPPQGKIIIRKVVKESDGTGGWRTVENNNQTFCVKVFASDKETEVTSGIVFKVGQPGETVPLPYGKYYVKEIEIPGAYTVAQEEYEVIIDSAQEEVTVENRITPVVPQTGRVKVVKTIGPNSIPMNGVQFRLTINNDDIRYATTAVNGEAIFENVPAGTYTILETVPVGFETASLARSVTVEAGKTATVNVTNTPKVNQGQTYDPGLKIKGYKFNDLNKNGRRDVGEPGLPNWSIQLYRANLEVSLMPVTALNDDDPIATTKTDANGYYEFIGLGTGYYIVKEVPQTGWECSTGLQHMVHLTGGSYTGEITAVNLLDDANFKKAMPNANTVFEAEGRIGLPGERDYELALKTINPTTDIKAQKYVDGWKNFAEPQPFRLSLRHTGTAGNYKITITFEALGETIQTTLDNQYPNDIMIRTRSAEPGSGIIINNLVLDDPNDYNPNGTSIAGTSVAVNGVRDTDILMLPNLYFGVYSNFDLTGKVMMYWDGEAVPERSELAFQIAVGDTEQSQTKFVDFGNYQTEDPEEPNPPTITKTDERTSASLGDLLTYKITIDPNDYNLHGAYLLESPDLFTEYAGGAEWELVETKADGRKIYRHNLQAYMPTLRSLDTPYVPQIPEFKVRVKSETPRSIVLVTNNVKLYFDEEKDPASATDTTTISHPPIIVDPPSDPPDTPVVNPGKPDLKVTKTDNGAMVSPGALVQYFIEVENKGTAYAQGVKVYETLPEDTTFVANDNQGWTLENGKYVYNLGLLNVGEKKTVKFVLQINNSFPAGKNKVLNDVEVKDNGTETATTDNKASDDTPVLGSVPVVVEPPVPPVTPEPEKPETVVTEPEPEVPDLPFTGGVAEVELLFAGIGVLLMAGGIVMKKRR